MDKMAALFLDQSGFIASIITDLTNNLTGSLFLTLMLIMVFFIVIALMFRFPIEISAIILAPLFLVFMASTGEFVAVGGVVLIYLGIIIAKNFILK